MTARQFTAIRLQFSSAITFSTGKPDTSRGQDHLLSDTIKSALASAYVKLNGDQGLLDFWESFRVSSAFPYVGEEYGLPIPLRGFRIQVGDDGHAIKYRKRLARLRYLSLPLYQRTLMGERLHIHPEQLSADGSMAYAQATEVESESRFKRTTAQRVSINPGLISGAGYDPEPFFLEQMFHDHHSGWYFLVEWTTTATDHRRNELSGCLRLLQDEGLGLAKSRGMGQFTYTERSLALQIPDAANYQITLSLYCPGPGELNATNLAASAWNLVKRGGYIAVSSEPEALHLRKKSIFMLTEGSVFPIAHQLQGQTVDLRPDNHALWRGHAVYREGRPISLPFCSASL